MIQSHDPRTCSPSSPYETRRTTTKQIPTKQGVVNLIHMPSETKAQPNREQKWTITTSMKRCFTTHTTSRAHRVTSKVSHEKISIGRHIVV
ncbi:hypothetical protein GOBAR_DD36260 [Gossypium barbadense]|nr:hypothetical protein GOBAR_DD36260 [Gossypium barbadense]